jgi:hypothetical protein
MMKQCTIHITIQYPESRTEVCADEEGSVELAIEDKMAPLMAELFGAPMYVDDVTVEFSVPGKQYDDEFLFRV